jgi:dihydroorotate dehydrogenase
LPLVIIGTGGIMSGQDVYTKIRLGAHLVQIYSSLVYYGPTLIQSLEDELVSLLKRDGFNHIKDAIGVDL